MIVNTPQGRDWFHRYLLQQPPLDAIPFFHVHLYFMDNVESWLRDWEAFKALCGAQFRPTIVSETNLHGQDTAAQAALMDAVLRIAGGDSGLWTVYWYADRDWFGHWPWCNLRETNGSLTALGSHFRSKQG